MEIAIAIIGSGALSAIIGGIFTIISGKLGKNTKMQEGMKLLLLSSLKKDARDMIKAGKLDQDDYAAFCATYEAYKALGGDGWADMVKNEVEALKVKLDR